MILELACMKKLNLLVLTALTLLLLWAAREISWKQTLQIASSARVEYLLLAVAITVVRFLVWCAKWQLLVKQIAGGVSSVHLLAILLAGLFVSTSTPGAQVGGEPLRAYYLAREAGIKKSAAMATVMLDKAGNYAAFSVFSVISVLLLWPLLQMPRLFKLAGELLLVLLLLVLISSVLLRRGSSHAGVLRFVYHLPFLQVLRRKFSSYAAFEEFLSSRVELFLGTLHQISGRRDVLAANLLLSFAMWSTSYLKTYLVFMALGVDASLLQVTVVKTVAILAGMVSFLPGGVGATEAVMVALFAATGIEGSAALAGIILSRAIYYSFALGVGYACLLWLRLSYTR